MRECSPPTLCHMSHVRFYMSHVMCHVACVRCQVSGVFFLVFFFNFWLSLLNKVVELVQLLEGLLSTGPSLFSLFTSDKQHVTHDT